MCSSFNADSTEPYLEGSNLLTGGKTYRKIDKMKYHKAALNNCSVFLFPSLLKLYYCFNFIVINVPLFVTTFSLSILRGNSASTWRPNSSSCMKCDLFPENHSTSFESFVSKMKPC